MAIRRKKSASYTYDDLLCRASLTDDGTIPRTPPLQESPDVIPSGKTEIPDPGTYFDQNYDQNVAKPVVAEQQNLIYVRGKNLGELPQNGDVYVYWAPYELRNDPAVWKNNKLLTTGGHGSVPVVDVQPDAVAAATTPFAWTPDAALAGQAVTILGVLSTNEHPDPVPSLKPPFDFDFWITRKGGIGAWKTTVEQPPAPPKTALTDAAFALANAAGAVTFTLRASGMPVGSIVAFRSSEPDRQGNPIKAGPTRITVDPFVVSVDADVDANFQTRIAFEVTLPQGQRPATGNALSMSASQIPPGGGTAPRPVLLAQYETQIKAPVNAP